MSKTKKCSECIAEIPKEAKGRVGVIRATLIVLFVIIFLPVISSYIVDYINSSSAYNISEQDKKLEDRKAADEFTKNRKSVINKINVLLKNGNKIGASYETTRFINAGVKDDELTKISTKIEFELKKERAAEKAEKIRLANLNKTGIWTNSFYVDDFGEPTNKPYITNSKYISGFFSNTATQNSKLNVNFLISGKSNISIQLYEYARNNPVKSYGGGVNQNYSILVKDKDGKKYKLYATNWSERLTLGKSNAKKLHKILMKGGIVSFRIVNSDTGSDQYGFEIIATYYDNAYRKLKEAYKRK